MADLFHRQHMPSFEKLVDEDLWLSELCLVIVNFHFVRLSRQFDSFSLDDFVGSLLHAVPDMLLFKLVDFGQPEDRLDVKPNLENFRQPEVQNAGKQRSLLKIVFTAL